MTRRRLFLAALAVVAVGVCVWLAFRTPVPPPDLTPDAVPDRWQEAQDAQGLIPGGAGDRIAFDRDAQSVMRKGPNGEARWSTRLDGLSRVRPPHVADAHRAYVSRAGGVTALDVKTGAAVWQSPGPGDYLLLSGDLLLATDCSNGDHIAQGGRWVVARRTADGSEAFRVALPAGEVSPDHLSEAEGLFVVQEMRRHAAALLIDRTGQVVHRLDRQVVLITRIGADRLVLTDRGVVRMTADGRQVWNAQFEESRWNADGGLHLLPDGSAVCYLYGQISDSSVTVARLDAATGRLAWQAHCRRLGVTHSEYWHRAVVSVNGGQVKVTSCGYGTFVEVLDAGTGRSLGRRVLRPDE